MFLKEKDYKLLSLQLNNGGDPKMWILLNNERYLVKFTKIDNKKGVLNHWENVKCEHICSKFLYLLGLDVHQTKLIQIEYNNSIYHAVLCKDFTQELGELKTFKEYTDSIATDRFQHGYYFEEILHVLSKTHKIVFSEIEDAFWDMYMSDLINANSDRHWGNWGIVKKNGKRRMAPIFDNGAGLLPRAKFQVTYNDTDSGNEKDWWKRRVYEFPNSKIMFRPPIRERSNYYDTWNSDIIPDKVREKFKSIYTSGIFQKAIDNLFLDEKYITKEQEEFIKKFYILRYRCIIMNENFDDVYKSTEQFMNSNVNVKWK